MNPYNAILATTFGAGSTKPVRMAYTKILLLWLSSLGIGIVLSLGAPSLPASNSWQQFGWLLQTAFISQVAVVLSVGPAFGVIGGKSRSNQILLTLPLSHWQQNWTLLMPSVVVAICGLSLTVPVMLMLVTGTGAPIVWICVSILFGAVSAFGLLHGVRTHIWKIPIIFAVFFAEYKLVGNILASENNRPLWAALFLLVLVALSKLAWQSGTRIQTEAIRSATADNIRTHWLSPGFWFAKKMWRDSSLRIGFGVTIMLSALLAYFAAKYHLLKESSVLLIGQVLAASFASDIRSLARRLLPPEIVALRGYVSFVTTSLFYGVSATIIALLPLLSVATLRTSYTYEPLMQIITGAVLGSMVGFVLTPSRRDISGQVSAGVLCLSIVLVPQQLLGHAVANAPPFYPILWLGALIVTYGIERKRNTFTWR